MRSDDDRLYAKFGLDPPDQKRCRMIDDGDRNPRVCWVRRQRAESQTRPQQGVTRSRSRWRKPSGLRSRPMPHPHDPAVRLRGSPGSIRGSAHHGGQCITRLTCCSVLSRFWYSGYDANGDPVIPQDELVCLGRRLLSSNIMAAVMQGLTPYVKKFL